MAEGYPTLELAQNDGRPTLELFKHDETARAPERDKDTTAFELDASCLAPEVSLEVKWEKMDSEYKHRFYLAQDRSCSTGIRYPKLLVVSRSPQKVSPVQIPPSLSLNSVGCSLHSLLLQRSQSASGLESGIPKEKARLGPGMISYPLYITIH